MTFSTDPTDLFAEFFCHSLEHRENKKAINKIKAFRLPICAMRHLKAGTVWQHGKNISPRPHTRRWQTIDPESTKLVLCSTSYSTEEIIERLTRSKRPHFTFLKFTNYLVHKSRKHTTYIPCSEVIRYYMAPSDRYLKLVLSGTIGELLKNHDANHSSKYLKGKITKKEISTTIFLSSSTNSITAAQLPYKSLKLTHIKNMLKKDRQPFLLNSRIPTTREFEAWVRHVIFRKDNSPYRLFSIVLQLHENTDR